MKKESLFPIGSAAILGIGLFIAGCNGNATRVDEQEWTTTEKVEYTKGLITYLEETEADEFKIIDEQIVERKEDSRVITTYLDGSTDTLTFAQTQQTDENNPRRRSGIHSIIMMGFMGRMMSRNATLQPQAYKSNSIYQSVAKGTGKALTESAIKTVERKVKPRTTTKPRSSSKGYGGGSSRSTRSYGG